jgi:hypothetical protein
VSSSRAEWRRSSWLRTGASNCALVAAAVLASSLRTGPPALAVGYPATLDVKIGDTSSYADEGLSARLAVNPAPDGAATWVITLDAPYCGGFRVGDGVYLQLLDAFSWPDTVPTDAVSFADGPALIALDQVAGVLQVSPAPGRIWAQFCVDGGTVPLTVTLAPSLGLDRPSDGQQALQVWTSESPVPVVLAASVGNQAPTGGLGDDDSVRSVGEDSGAASGPNSRDAIGVGP